MDNRKALDKFLKGNASEQEVKQIREWFEDGCAREELHREYAGAWDSCSDEMLDGAKEGIWERLSEVLDADDAAEPERTGIWRTLAPFLTGMAACLAIMLGVYVMYSPGYGETVITADRGQKTSVILPDGTDVILNSATVLKYSNKFGIKERTVYLNGQAYFDVAKDGTEFVVQTKHLDVKVRGTSFDVEAYEADGEVTATVVSGMVEVTEGEGKSVELRASDRLCYSVHRKEFAKSRVDDLDNVGVWRKNQVGFDGESFEEIALKLSRLYNVEIVFASEDVKQYTFSGIIRNNSLLNVIETLSLAAPVKCELDGNVLIINDDDERTPLYQ